MWVAHPIGDVHLFLGRCRAIKLASPSGPGNEESMAFKFAVVSRDGDVFESFKSAVPN
jgi:hypothetical protein